MTDESAKEQRLIEESNEQHMLNDPNYGVEMDEDGYSEYYASCPFCEGSCCTDCDYTGDYI